MARTYKGYSVRKQANGNYLVIVSNGRKSNGKQHFERALFRPDPLATDKQNQRALETFCISFEQKVRAGKYLDGEHLTLETFSKRWLKEYAEKNLEKSSISNYRRNLEKIIIPILGNIPLAKITPYQLNVFYNSLLKDGSRLDGKEGGYSPASIKKIHVTLSSVFSTAVQWQIMDNNPCQRVRVPKQNRQNSDIQYFTLEQARCFLECLDMEFETSYAGHSRKDAKGNVVVVSAYTEKRKIPLQLKVFFYISLFGGTRKGETLGLTWDDVDFENKCIMIRQSAGTIDREVIIKAPKTATSTRTISLPDIVISLLRQHKAEQSALKLRLGDYWDRTGNYLFTQSNGTLMNTSTPYHAFKDILRKYNATVTDESLKLPEIALHGLRHTSATLLVAQNVDIKTISSRLGHAKVSTTLDIYSHSLKKKDEECSDMLGNIFQVNA